MTMSSNVTTVNSKELERMKQGRVDQILQNALPNVQIWPVTTTSSSLKLSWSSSIFMSSVWFTAISWVSYPI